MSYSWRNCPEPPLDPPEDEREVVATCVECGEPIREGDVYYELSAGCVCEYCLSFARRVG